MKTAIVVLGNQLLKEHPAIHENKDAPIFIIEADDICGKRKYHKHKLLLVLTAMREYADSLRDAGRTVHYTKLQKDSSFYDELENLAQSESIEKLVWMSPSDRPAAESLRSFCSEHDLESEEYANAQFLLTKGEFEQWYSNQKSPKMENFYRWHRKRTEYLMDGDEPEGGEWNYDKENREPLPKKGIDIPELLKPELSAHHQNVAHILEELYPDNPGETANFWLPTTHELAEKWLRSFIKERFENFGTYEDAMAEDEPFLFHSVLSPLINLGLLTPKQVLDAATDAYKKNKALLNSVEGFVRQILGWREYMHGLYWQKEDMMDSNFFDFTKPLEDWWYTDEWQEQDLPKPIKHALKTVHEYGYSHHIERLMVFGNWFLLNEYNPKSVYEWFSSMYVDAYEWVMVPNVQGMSQYADGGFVATKPYISGGNYLQKMGHFWDTNDQAKNSEFNKLYWDFLYKNREKLKGNHRMSIALSQAEKMHKPLNCS